MMAPKFRPSKVPHKTKKLLTEFKYKPQNQATRQHESDERTDAYTYIKKNSIFLLVNVYNLQTSFSFKSKTLNNKT